jgi:hypothetical protein
VALINTTLESSAAKELVIQTKIKKQMQGFRTSISLDKEQLLTVV